MSKHRRIPIWAGLAAAVAISLAPATPGRAADRAPWRTGVHDGSRPEPAEAQVRALVNRMIEAFNAGDVRGASALFTPDGDLIAGDGTLVSTRAGIERFLADLHAKLPKGTQFLSPITHVRFAGPDFAIVITDGGWKYPGETEVSDKNRGTHTAVAIRQKGEWRVALYQRTRKAVAPPVQK